MPGQESPEGQRSWAEIMGRTEKGDEVARAIEEVDEIEALRAESQYIEVPKGKEVRELEKLDAKWSAELEPLVEGFDIYEVVSPEGKEGRSLDEEKDDFFRHS